MVAVANAEQAAAWDGGESLHWTAYEQHYNAAVARHEPRLHEAASITPGERVLDVGCGCGESTRHAARAAVSGSALGVDLSARMIARARERAQDEGLTNVRFEQADAQVYPFQPESFDVAISRFGSTFFADPVAAFGNIGRGLRPGGRLVMLAWQEFARNEWLRAIRGALAQGRLLADPPVGVPGPFGLADPQAARSALTAAGFDAVHVADVAEPVWLGVDAADAMRFLRGTGLVRGLLNGLDHDTAARALRDLSTVLAAHETADGVLFDSAARLISAHRSRATTRFAQ